MRRARGQVKPDELRGATISLTNPGGLGTVASVPRLMPGQGIVATGAIGHPPGWRGPLRPEGLGVEKVMTMTSTYDHRVIQGAESGEFLARIEALLRGDDGFYEEVRESLGLGAAAPAPERAPAAAEAPAPSAPVAGRRRLLAGVAAAMSVVKAHGAGADLDPLGARPRATQPWCPRTSG